MRWPSEDVSCSRDGCIPRREAADKGNGGIRSDRPSQADHRFGEIAKDGTLRLSTFAASDGAIAGEHRVAVVSDYEIGTGVERPGELPPLQIHPKFRSFKTSGPKFTIKPRMNNILVEVDYAHADAATKFTGRLRPISLGHMLEFGPLSELANDFVIVSSGQLSQIIGRDQHADRADAAICHREIARPFVRAAEVIAVNVCRRLGDRSIRTTDSRENSWMIAVVDRSILLSDPPARWPHMFLADQDFAAGAIGQTAK